MTLELFKDRKGKWRFRIVAANGETWQSGQAYSTKSNARRAARTFRQRALAGIRILEEGKRIDDEASAADQEAHAVAVVYRTQPVGPDQTPWHLPCGVILDGGTSLCIDGDQPIVTTEGPSQGTTVTVSLIAKSVEHVEYEKAR